MPLIHKFKIHDTYMVIDVNSGAVHEIDEISYHVLDYYPKHSLKDTIELLNKRYSATEISEVIEEIDILIKEKMLYSDNFCEEDNIQKLHKDQVIKAMCLHVAHDCNIRCKYCFASQGDFSGQRLMMPLEVGKRAIDFLIDNSGSRRNLEIDFFGGEPLMNFDVVKKIIQYARDQEERTNKRFRFTITTNATLLTEETMRYINKHMDNIVLSIDGMKSTNDLMRPTINGKGTYEIILPKIKRMVEKRGCRSHYVRGTFTKYNLDFAKDVLHLSDLGFKEISVEPVVADANKDYAITKEDLATIFDEYEKLAIEYLNRRNTEKEFNFFHFIVDLKQGPCVHKRLSGCGAGNEYVAITPEGDIYPCHQFVGNELFVMGNVIDGIVQAEIREDFKNAHVLNKEKCSDCWAKFYCSGGCHANAYNFNRDINIPYEVGCKMEKKRLECALMIQAHLMEGI